MTKPPFFIVGVGRSGTTLIRLMLHSHPNIAIPYESHFITDYSENEKLHGDLNNDQNLKMLLNSILQEDLLQKWDHQFDLDTLFNSIENRTLQGVFDAIYKDYAMGKGKLRWGDKSDYLDRIHLINNIFPDAKFIHIIRDGRDVASSVMKLPWGPNDIIHAAEWWAEHVRLGRAVGAVLGDNRYLEIKYEELVISSENELKKICNFLGENYDNDMLLFYKDAKKSIPKDRKQQHYNSDKPANSKRTFAWKKEMSVLDIEIFENYAGNQLRNLGYEISAPRCSKLLLRLKKIMIFAKRLVR